jgi:DNA-binding IclR family transcriptional regulator
MLQIATWFPMVVSAVSYAMQVLEALADEREGLSVSELSARCSLNKGSIARILITLEHSAHVLQDPATGRYHLSLRTVSIANRHLDRLGFPTLIQPVLNELARATGELAQLSAAHADRLYVIAKAEGDNRIRVESLLGREIALHASATGKAWLSGLPRDEMLRILSLADRRKLMPATVTQLSVLEKEIEEARERGYAVQREELMDHMCAIGVAIHRSSETSPVGALVIAAPTFRFPQSRMIEIWPALKDAAERIGAVWPTSGVGPLATLASENALLALTPGGDV